MLRYTAQIIPTLPTLAIDLATALGLVHAVASSSSELPQVMEFGECIDYSEDLILDQGPHLILLEAVLSTYHLPNGNCLRVRDYRRGWYHGPTRLQVAALRFLSERASRETFEHRTSIIEGFHELQTTSKTDHSDDAMKMLVTSKRQSALRHIQTANRSAHSSILRQKFRRYNFDPVKNKNRFPIMYQELAFPAFSSLEDGSGNPESVSRN